MLTHQLACINISFPIHISSHSIQAITCKQNTSNIFSPTINPDFLQSHNSTWVVHGQPLLIKHRSHFFGTEIHGHFQPHNTQSHFHGFLNKEYSSRRKPLLSGVYLNSTKSDPRVALAVGSNLPLGSPRFDGPIIGNSREKVELLSLKSLSFLSPFLRLLSPLPKLVGQAWVKRFVFSLATCQPTIGS